MRSRWLARFTATPDRESPDDLVAGPIRGDLLGAEQLAECARGLARGQRAVVRRLGTPARLLSRLQATRRVLNAAQERIQAAHTRGADIGPAGEWLLDNYHVVQEHILEVTESLPRGYYRELPELSRGTLTGYPRMYELAIGLISHSEARIDIENVELFVAAFQEVAPLSLGELWATPAMLRLGLIESVRRMALRTVQRLADTERADAWVERIRRAHDEGADALSDTLRTFVAATHAPRPVFTARLLSQLRLTTGYLPQLVWLESWISDEGLHVDEATARATERTALTQLMMANSITSLRAIARLDWRAFVERQSVIEQILRDDPTGCYGGQTFTTRDRCRHVVERIARRRRLSERDIAQLALDLARDAAARDPASTPQSHVGYYLLDQGLAELEYAADYSPPLAERLLRVARAQPAVAYFAAVGAALAAALLALLWLSGVDTPALWLPIVLLALFPASDLAISTVNQLVTLALPPGVLPRLDFERLGIPASAQTVVVVPTLFASVDAAREALDHLEVQYLANRNEHLSFALLSDFTDAATEHTPDDDAIIATAMDGIEALNQRYTEPDTPPVFFVFHRQRLWNAAQGVWMGWERKRGKLSEFNRLLRDETMDAFPLRSSDPAPLRSARYVITLDSDTILPPDAAAQLVGTIAHPLNQFAYDAEHAMVIRGYGIIQPRVGVSLPSAHRSRFAAIFSGQPGVDPYSNAVSDVYQDLFGEGSFTGKGIYDIDAFEQATAARFPENRLLSHDLIEGNYARVGLATDISLYDEYPSRYLTFTRRKHRWIRGDWQLLQWLTSQVPGPQGLERNRLSSVSRWKIFDNLRRSVVEISQLLFLLAGWTVLPGSPLRWTLLGLAAIAAPWLITLLIAALRPPWDKSWRAYYAEVGQDAVRSAQQWALAVVFLPHQAWVSADAIVRTLYRLAVSHRSLLEWQTASQSEQVMRDGRRDLWRTMWPAVAIAVLLLVIVGAEEVWRSSGAAPGPIPAAEHLRRWLLGAAIVPLLVCWVFSPAIARRLSEAVSTDDRRLGAAHRQAAVRYALLHWRFFERFVTARTHWLAPDNMQDDPEQVVAMRTSPTNIGLQLLSTVSACDLGFIHVDAMTRQLELTFQTLEGLPRFHGHFFNWYDLHTLEVMDPHYVSTVDSGNLAGHLIALRQACRSVVTEPVFDGRSWRALDAALALAQERLQRPDDAPLSAPHDAADGAIADARAALHAAMAATTRRTDATATETPPDLAPISASLRAARSLLVTTARGDVHSPDVEWIDWSLRHLDSAALCRTTCGVAAHDASPWSLHDLAATHAGAADLVSRLEAIAERAFTFAMAMDFRFLLEPSRKLLAIGYQTGSHTLDASYYDLLASEARLASFVGILKRDLPTEHWFRLGRTLTATGGDSTLVSWSGSMFEYLMPLLIMESFPGTLLDQTCHTAVRRQIAYARERNVPWGVSESAYNLRDRHLTYQYRAFGIPDLALKRGLGRDLVIAPYASMLAAMVDLPEAMENLAALEALGALGDCGFRDAVDFTRPTPPAEFAIVGNYMAHHVGMAFVSLTNVLCARVWQRRFHAEPLVRSTDLLLHERVPRRLVLQEPQEATPERPPAAASVDRITVREFDAPETPSPHIALLGSAPYTLMITHTGAGYSRCDDRWVTRWRADGTRDDRGQFCYVRDITDARTWSAAYQPTCTRADWARASLATDRVTFHRADGLVETRTEIAVVPQDAAEVRRVTVTNNSSVVREIELTSYGEIVLGPHDADTAHPAFANLFVETEWHEWCTALTATRRPRSATEATVYLVHVVDAVKEQVGAVSHETDRGRFIGRTRSTRAPRALQHDGPLDGITGPVLDPIFAIRTRVQLEPGQSASVAFTTLVAPTKERAMELAGRYHDSHASQRAFDLAWTATQLELQQQNIIASDAAVYQELGGHLLFPHAALRAPSDVQRRNRGAQPRLWTHGISGDWPILLVTIASAEELPTLRQIFAAHHYLRHHGLLSDLVVLNAHAHTYYQELDDRITEAMIAASDAAGRDQPGGVFVRRRDLLTADDLLMLQATARVTLRCDGRSLGAVLDSCLASAREQEHDADLRDAEHAPRAGTPSTALVRLFRNQATSIVNFATDTAQSVTAPAPRPQPPRRAARSTLLQFDNGFGGFTSDGDYEITVTPERHPPAPWINVIANEQGGCLVSESGAGCTWAGNSYFYRLTPWHNDPVSDPISEVLYLRDEESGDVWSATPAPIHTHGEFTVRHAPARTTFAHEHDGIATELSIGMAVTDAVKCSVLRITNTGPQSRRLAVTAFVEWTLGVSREASQYTVQTQFDRDTATITARNRFDAQFGDWLAFLSISEPARSHSGNRRSFIGRNGTLSDPAALRRDRLDDTTGAGLDPCGALQCVIDLGPGQTREITVLLGAAEGDAAARALVTRYRLDSAAQHETDRNVAAWHDRLSVITVRTPVPSFDLLVNRWSLYQTIACRMWARAALYQSSGAFGFRDQLQDAMALVYVEPALARAHLLRCASRQFPEGDVQHWWHPQSGRGVRTRFSDDLAWLPFVMEHYVRVTGDHTLLDETAPFLEMPPLADGEHERYDLPAVSTQVATVYEHCQRALQRACTTGERGLPLIGSGDWNDGMSRVGIEGRGESVWLAWFLIRTLRSFADLADERNDRAAADHYRSTATAYAAAAEASAWDGEWYRRAWFDDGTPLGAASEEECRIDSIAQSWSVISGAADPERQARALASAEHWLVNEDARLILLLTPAFDATPHDPGYIKGYVPGVRENGAQYTHAALWMALATAMRGDGDRAFELLQMVNPVTHTATARDAETYRVEPYAIAADVYTAAGQLGRGGWTWYTGSASWHYRIAVESILGFTLAGTTLTIAPVIPASWPGFSLDYRHGTSLWRVTVENPAQVETGVTSVTVDGALAPDLRIHLVDDGATHDVLVRLG